MNNLTRFFKLWVPVVGWMGVIFFFSSIPDLKTELKYDFLLREIAHTTEYFILTFLLHRAFKGSFDMKVSYLFVWPAAISVLYAVSDEIHQLFVIGRNCSARDVLIDTVGVLGFYIFIKMQQRERAKHI